MKALKILRKADDIETPKGRDGKPLVGQDRIKQEAGYVGQNGDKVCNFEGLNLLSNDEGEKDMKGRQKREELREKLRIAFEFVTEWDPDEEKVCKVDRIEKNKKINCRFYGYREAAKGRVVRYTDKNAREKGSLVTMIGRWIKKQFPLNDGLNTEKFEEEMIEFLEKGLIRKLRDIEEDEEKRKKN